ncbi:MAG: prevent-host-death protein [Myxococcales bacterium]|nr:prevent-host-death protein [Myxococcales bacterium]
MKPAPPPLAWITPRLRQELAAVLGPEETIPSFLEEAVRAHIAWRRTQREFLKQGLLEAERARGDNDTVSAAEVLARMDARLEPAPEKKRGRKRG